MVDRSGVRWRKAVGDDSVRLVTGTAEAHPATEEGRDRHDAGAGADRHTREVIDVKRHAARYGGFHVLLRSLKDTEQWDEPEGHGRQERHHRHPVPEVR